MADTRDDAAAHSANDQAKGLGNELKGKGRNALGGLTGDMSEQFKGKAEELKGKAQKELGKAEAPRTDDR